MKSRSKSRKELGGGVNEQKKSDIVQTIRYLLLKMVFGK